MPTMEKGDVLGHQPIGEVVEAGPGVKDVKVGDRVIVSFTIDAILNSRNLDINRRRLFLAVSS